MTKSCDVMVLGAGIIGVSTALHLVLAGRTVTLIDRRGPGEETSYGNAGLVEVSSLRPAPFPAGFRALFDIVTGRNPQANFHWSALPALAPWLLAFRHYSTPEKLLAHAKAMRPLVAASLAGHQNLARLAGVEALFRDGGWLKLYRYEKSLAAEREEIELGEAFGLSAKELSVPEALAEEPQLSPTFLGAVRWSSPHSVSSPGLVTKGYAEAFRARGGTFHLGDAKTLTQTAKGWRIETSGDGAVEAREVVIALGPWSMDVLTPLGYRMPLAVKRGYHMHYRTQGNATLSTPILDEDGGYVLTPMQQGMRLTTGAEFALRDAPATPIQLDKTEALARALFPLAERMDATPWKGARPIFPDSFPAIGRMPKHKTLWAAFGHQHLGFTLGPVTGQLIAEMITGKVPFMDARPFDPGRF